MRTLFGEDVEDLVDKQKETVKSSDINIWAFVNSISQSKDYIFSECTSKIYEPWIINKSFSSYIDTFSDAEFLNANAHIDKNMQHDYLFYQVAKKYRKSSWLKKTSEEKITAQILLDIVKSTKCDRKTAKYVWSNMSEKERKSFLSLYVYPDTKNT